MADLQSSWQPPSFGLPSQLVSEVAEQIERDSFYKKRFPGPKGNIDGPTMLKLLMLGNGYHLSKDKMFLDSTDRKHNSVPLASRDGRVDEIGLSEMDPRVQQSLYMILVKTEESKRKRSAAKAVETRKRNQLQKQFAASAGPLMPLAPLAPLAPLGPSDDSAILPGHTKQHPVRSDIGRHIFVFWAADSEWYPGVLVDIEAGHDDGADTGNYKVLYDDGDEHWEPLDRMTFIFRAPPAPPPPPLGAALPPPPLAPLRPPDLPTLAWLPDNYQLIGTHVRRPSKQPRFAPPNYTAWTTRPPSPSSPVEDDDWSMGGF